MVQRNPRRDLDLKMKVLETQLFIRKYVGNLSKKVTSLTSSNTKMKRELDEVRFVEVGTKEALERAVEKLAILENLVAQLRASLKSSENKLSQTDASLANALEGLDKAADDAVIQTGASSCKNTC
ncbi:hypothetical protein Ddye_022332 [Dipteronia dyeriana]|uniref:Uncharacterized protein n=1 Tax=Dipteronia dyeriana TaxID=168575 RepID=A0AAD9U3F8_9ROSI|nr:hypothetical protein Ddye_022332 [Dipteronia dyeriana]